LPVIGSAAAIGWIAVPSHHDFNTHRLTAFDGRIDVGYFKPKRHPIPVRPLGRVADGAVVMVHQPGMQLQHETPIVNESLVFGPAVGALTAEQSLIPAAAGLHVAYADQGLGMHESSLRLVPKLSSSTFVENSCRLGALHLGELEQGPGWAAGILRPRTHRPH